MLYFWTQKLVKLLLFLKVKIEILYEMLVFITHGKNIKILYNNNKFKISAPTWNDKFELPDGWYSVPGVQDYFEYIFKKQGKNIDNPSVKTYVNKIENRITFRVKNGYILELLTPGTMKLLGSTKNKITKDKNGENVPHPRNVILVHCNTVNNVRK